MAKIAGQNIQRLKAVQPEAASTQPEAASCISSGMTVLGNIVVDGSVMVYGHVEGELQGSDVVICEGAQVASNIIAKELTVDGRVRGTIHAVNVKLHNTAVVEGDIFHWRLAIEIWRACWAEGSATITTEASRTIISWAMPITASAQ